MVNIPPEIQEVSDQPLTLKALDESEKEQFLPFLEKVKDQPYTIPTALHYLMNIRGQYVPLLNMFFPDSSLTVDDPQNTTTFFGGKLEEFLEESREKLKVFRE